jgi:hypothetical protein
MLQLSVVDKTFKKNQEELIVYWAPYTIKEQHYHRLLVNSNLKSLMHDIIQRKEKNPSIPNSENLQTSGYQSCTALHELVKNTYILPSPFDLDVHLTTNGEIIRNNSSAQYFLERVSSFKDSFAVDLSLGILLFSESSVNIEVTHPYMNKTSYTDLGFLVSAEYNISSWFRPVALIYHLWENVRNLKFWKMNHLPILNLKLTKKLFSKDLKLQAKLKIRYLPVLTTNLLNPTSHSKNYMLVL